MPPVDSGRSLVQTEQLRQRSDYAPPSSSTIADAHLSVEYAHAFVVGVVREFFPELAAEVPSLPLGKDESEPESPDKICRMPKLAHADILRWLFGVCACPAALVLHAAVDFAATAGLAAHETNAEAKATAEAALEDRILREQHVRAAALQAAPFPTAERHNVPGRLAAALLRRSSAYTLDRVRKHLVESWH